MRRIFIVLTLILFVIQAHTQPLAYKSFDWGKISIPVVNDTVDKVILKKKSIIEFVNEDGGLWTYQLVNQVEYINSSDQVKRNNKKYIPFQEGSEVIVARARLINPKKEEIVLDESKIFTSVNDETGEHYRYFAFEGLEPGSLIEYYYVIKKVASYNGISLTIQERYDIQQYEFDLYAPNYLVFEFKTVNDTNQVIYDTTSSDRYHWSLYMDNISRLVEEDLAPYDRLLKKVKFKLDRNTNTNSRDITSYGRASTNLFTFIYQMENKDASKVVKKFLKSLSIKDDMSTEEKVKAIESDIKTNIRILPNKGGPEYSQISNVISSKLANTDGLIRLYAQCFRSLGIKHEVVLTCDVTKNKFDREFETYNFLEEYLIFFPETKKYIIPSKFEYRYGLVPFEYMNNDGLFIRERKLGEFSTGVGEVKFIEPLEYTESYSDLDIKVEISNSFDKADLDITMKSQGYYSIYTQPYYNLLTEEKREQLVEVEAKNLVATIELDEWDIKNGEAKYVGNKPLIINFKATHNALIDVAGETNMIKVGELIGPQYELYSKEKRTLPLDTRHKRMYTREIVINIPAGYKIVNLKDLNISADHVKNTEKVMMFKSSYKIEGNLLKISIQEYYDQILFEADEYQHYRRVVNSAAEFNKVILVYEKI